MVNTIKVICSCFTVGRCYCDTGNTGYLTSLATTGHWCRQHFCLITVLILDNGFCNNGGLIFPFWITLCWLFLFLAVICRLFQCSLVPLKAWGGNKGKLNFCLFCLASSLFSVSKRLWGMRVRIVGGELDGRAVYPSLGAFLPWHQHLVAVTVLELGGCLVWPTAPIFLTRGEHCWGFGRNRRLSYRIIP